MVARSDLLTTSQAYDNMKPYWDDIAAIRGGRNTMMAAADKYLPKFPHESSETYKGRKERCRFTDIFSDIAEGLAGRPFEKEAEIVIDKDKPQFKALVDFGEDVDGQNNHLNTFAGSLFLKSILNAIEWVLVDYPTVREGATVAEVRAAGANPYFVRIAAQNVLMAVSAQVGGKRECVYFKFIEQALHTDKEGKTKLVDQVRIFERVNIGGVYQPATFEVYRATGTKGTATEFELIEEGSFAIGVIPVVPLALSEFDNDQYEVRPPLKNLAELQIEYFQEENGLKHIKTLTAHPMYVAVGMSQPLDETGSPAVAPVGASAVWFTGTVNKDEIAPDLKIVEPQGNSLTFLANERLALEKQMRELGRMPLIAGTAGITQVAASYASKKATSALQDWANRLKDALEKALAFVVMWQGYQVAEVSPSVFVYTDFTVEMSDAEAPRILLDAYNAGIISRKTLREEYQRRGILSPDYDHEADDVALLDEVPTGDDNQEFETKPVGGKVDDRAKRQKPDA